MPQVTLTGMLLVNNFKVNCKTHVKSTPENNSVISAQEANSWKETNKTGPTRVRS